jgi:hypothetical protein
MSVAEDVAPIPLTSCFIKSHFTNFINLAIFYLHCSMIFFNSTLCLTTQRPCFAHSHAKETLPGRIKSKDFVCSLNTNFIVKEQHYEAHDSPADNILLWLCIKSIQA